MIRAAGYVAVLLACAKLRVSSPGPRSPCFQGRAPSLAISIVENGIRPRMDELPRLPVIVNEDTLGAITFLQRKTIVPLQPTGICVGA